MTGNTSLNHRLFRSEPVGRSYSEMGHVKVHLTKDTVYLRHSCQYVQLCADTTRNCVVARHLHPVYFKKVPTAMNEEWHSHWHSSVQKRSYGMVSGDGWMRECVNV
jgi:hypothetical protein